MSKNSISVIIPNYNGQEIILNCLKYVYDQRNIDYEIIVIDDKSDDKSLGILKQEAKKKRIKLEVNKERVGYAGSCFAGAKLAKNEVLFFLNSDAFLINNKHLVKTAELLSKEKEIGVLGFYQLNPDKSPQFIGSNIDLTLSLDPKSSNQEFIQKKISSSSKIISDLFMTGGAAYAIKKEIYLSAGGIDKSYFLYFDELDLMWRVRLLGYKVVTDTSLKIIHLGGWSTKNEYNKTTNYTKIYLNERNSFKTILKNYQTSSLLFIIPLFFLMQFIQSLYFLVTIKPRGINCYLRANYQVITNLNEIFKLRNKIQKNRKVPDKVLINKSIIIDLFKIKNIFKGGIPKVK
ncbi:MAG: glycosyltransferase [Candidatus Pacearchaeota archaeon]|jgi:hypothetical protein